MRTLNILIPAALLALAQNPIPEWTYAGPNGPAHWSALDPSYAACNNGHAQSPIDIRASTPADLPPLQFSYKSDPLKYLINNSHAIRVNYHDPLDFLTVADTRYQLYQFHFHRPSEELLNGHAAAMDLHLMHRAPDGSEAAVAVQMEPGPANPTFQKILDHMSPTPGPEQDIPGISIDPATLLPPALGYYSYPGSLSGPPCTENVRWYILKTPITVSPAQIAAYARLYPRNVRPVQPLNGRTVSSTR